MKYFISHRGNINGRIPEKENHPDYILQAINAGYDVEIDVWYVNNQILLGHDEPQYEISLDFLLSYCHKLWCHAKNFAALTMMHNYKDKLHFFSHDLDTHVLTSKGIIWSYIGKQIDKNTICVMPELATTSYTKQDFINCLGFCSDNVQFYRIMYKNNNNNN
jgi:hypothetical protein